MHPIINPTYLESTIRPKWNKKMKTEKHYWTQEQVRLNQEQLNREFWFVVICMMLLGVWIGYLAGYLVAGGVG